MNTLNTIYKLRPILLNDNNDLFELYSNKKVVRLLDMEVFTELTDADNYITNLLNDSTIYYTAITQIHSNKLIGTCAIKHINTKHKFASISYALLPEKQGKGIMHWALNELIQIGLNELGLQRLEAQIHVDNKASIQLIEKLGFEREGLLRQNFLINEYYYDSYMYSIIKDTVH